MSASARDTAASIVPSVATSNCRPLSVSPSSVRLLSRGSAAYGLARLKSRGELPLRRLSDLAKTACSDYPLAKRDAPMVCAMRELAGRYPRFGYRRIQVFLARRGLAMSADRAHRIWRRAGLQVPRRRPRRTGSRSALRDECLGMQWFKNRVDASHLIESWRREQNAVRPHSSLGGLTPREFARSLKSTIQREAVF